MIVGFNPGGRAADFDLARATTIPDRHDYFPASYPLARGMLRLFERIEHRPLLEDSLKVNLVPFRTPSKRAWLGIAAPVRAALERVSREVCLDVVRTLAPARILTEGVETFDEAARWLSEAFALTPAAAVRGHRGRRIYASAAATTFTLIGIPHLSRPLARDDAATLAARLRAALA